MKCKDIDSTSKEGKLLTAACMVLRSKGPPEFKDKDGDEMLAQLEMIVDRLPS